MSVLKRTLWMALMVALTLPLMSSQALAGCGCDHPPPAFAPVMPAFGSPGTEIVLNSEKGRLRSGATYEVRFSSTKGGWPATAKGIAISRDAVAVNVPAGLFSGPATVTILDSKNGDHVFDSSLFTAMTLPRRLPAGDSIVSLNKFVAPVTADGTLLIPVDLQDIVEATQFAVAISNAPIRFTPEDVIFYNDQGVDLTLFTLAVENPTERQWGSYYGWDVDEDAGIVGTVYDTKVSGSPDEAQSDMLTYWRHEFITYEQAHLPGGTHEVSVDGVHPDGTYHVNHNQLVLAIRGTLNGQPLAPGSMTLDIVVTTVMSENPIEPEVMAEKVYGAEVYTEVNSGTSAYVEALSGETESIEIAAADEPEPMMSMSMMEMASEATITLAEASYNKKHGVTVHVTTSDGQPLSEAPKLSVIGVVQDLMMSWDSADGRYEYQSQTSSSLKGVAVVVTTSGGQKVQGTL